MKTRLLGAAALSMIATFSHAECNGASAADLLLLADKDTITAGLADCQAKGADWNAKNDYGETALTVAIGYGDQNLVAGLLEMGADANMMDDEETLPAAQLAGAFEDFGAEKTRAMFEMLVAAGVDLNKTDGFDDSALDNLAGTEGAAELMSYLIENGADANTANSSGHNALFKAVRDGCPAENLTVLLDAGARLDSLPLGNQDYLVKSAMVRSCANAPADVVAAVLATADASLQ